MTNSSDDLKDRTSSAADPELERLLSDAYTAPPVPRSLLKRLDRAVEAEWGHAPGLAKSRLARLPKALSRGARLAKAVPVAASLALVVVLAVVFSGDSRAFAWSSVMQALRKQGVVQMEGPHGTRWLSLADGVVGERTEDASRMLDLRQRVILERTTGAAEVRRRKLDAPGSAADRDRLLLVFLLGSTVSEDAWQRFAGAQIVDENWERVSAGDREEIGLHVQLETADAEHFQLDMTLNPETGLPLRCDATDSAAGSTATHDRSSGRVATSLAFSYPSVDVAELRKQDFPADLRVVDLSSRGEQPKDVATLERSRAETPVVPAIAPRPEANAEETRSAGVARLGVTADADTASDEPPMSGAPSEWDAVETVKHSDNEVVQQLDSLLAELWKENGVQPVPPADEEELLRRVYLDLAGRTPTVHEARAYLEDDSPDRYESLVDRLLESPDHASHLAAAWRRFLIPEGVDLTDFGGVEAFDRWLADRFARNEPYDELVRSLLLAEGRLSRSGPLLFYSAVKLDPNQLAARTARVFLGMRLECAECHDHPFESWTQRDFWGFAAFFTRISRPQAKLESVSTVMRVRDVDRGEVTLPETETVVPPKFLDGTEPVADEQGAARREQLAHWLTSPGNPYFARATANRVWAHMFGKGIVDPVDDFGMMNTPKSPELLDLLAGHLINTDFDLRELLRTVALSRAYRLSSGAATADEKRLDWFAQMHVKTLTAAQVYDCITVATMLDPQPTDDPYDFNVARFNNSRREQFLQRFRTPAGQRTEYHGGIPQALTLMNGTLIENATGLSTSGLLESLQAPFFTNKQRIEVLYLATLSRRPRPSEWEALNRVLPENASGDELQQGLADILWALLNSAEFTMNH